MVKFDGRDDNDYIRVAGYLSKYMIEAPAKVKKIWIKEEGYRGA